MDFGAPTRMMGIYAVLLPRELRYDPFSNRPHVLCVDHTSEREEELVPENVPQRSRLFPAILHGIPGGITKRSPSPREERVLGVGRTSGRSFRKYGRAVGANWTIDFFSSCEAQGRAGETTEIFFSLSKRHGSWLPNSAFSQTPLAVERA